jgi:predicted deacylase
MKNITLLKITEELELDSLALGEVHRLQIELSDNSLGVPWRIPVIIIKGMTKGKVLGLTAAVHGNELNGISTIFKLIEEVDPKKLSGTLILVPISNVPGYLMNRRHFTDYIDLNRIMPGSPKGSTSNLYAHFFTSKIISKFDYLLDLHTASHGRVNSLYLRADLENEDSRTLAYLQNPQIIVQKYDDEKTLRGWANDQGIPAITIEIGNPNAFQHSLIDETLEGILNTMKYLQMIDGEVQDMVTDATVCDHSYWIYSNSGGIIEVLPKLADLVKKGEVIAKVYDVFGQVEELIHADKSGIVIGKNVLPNCDAGARVLHLGVNLIEPEPEDIPGHDEFES